MNTYYVRQKECKFIIDNNEFIHAVTAADYSGTSFFLCQILQEDIGYKYPLNSLKKCLKLN